MTGDDGRSHADRRRADILRLVRDAPFVRVRDLAERLAVSEVTVRSDLETLHAEGRLHRVRGGAVPVSAPRREPSYVQSLGEHAAEKEAIGAAAAGLVQAGESLFLDAGTTTTAVAQALVRRADLEDVVIVTNALPIAFELEAAIPRFTVIVTGGTLRPLQHSLVEPLAMVLLEEHLHIDTAFLGCTGVDAQRGVTNINLPEAEVKRRVTRLARRRILVADASKIGVVSLAPVSPLGAVDLFVTSGDVGPDDLDRLEEAGTAIEVVTPAPVEGG